LDFFQVCQRENKGTIEVFADFVVGRSKDLMVRGKSFYAIWDSDRGLWSTDEYDVQRLVDGAIDAYAADLRARQGLPCRVKHLRSFGSAGWRQYRQFVQNVSDNSHQLDENLTFANSKVKKTDYVSKRLPYSLEEGDYSAWDELVGTLYNPEERQKIEWAIGAVISGDSKKIQKFLVFYGPPGSGKGTILEIIYAMFEGYVTSFDAKALGSNNGSFATEPFKDNPLVAIQFDGDLSRIEDNTRLNAIVSHEAMTMNEKYKPSYTGRLNTFLFMGTNLPVKITDAKSGIIRRLIDINPSGNRLPANHYAALVARAKFEYGAIAEHCLQVYRELGQNYYNNYRPIEMMLQTDIFFNFIEAHYDIFYAQNGVSLKQAYILYKEYCSETGIDRVLPQHKIRTELKNYFDEFHERYILDDEAIRSYYSGFNANKFKVPVKDAPVFSLVLEEETSLLDEMLADQPAQYGTANGIPKKSWGAISTKLSDLNTSKLHFVKVPENHIVIDFDLKGDDGGRDLERNLIAASDWPATYAELSQSGGGVHLHYVWTGSDVTALASVHSDGIEIKRYSGDASLRRKLTRSNNIPVAELSSGLPLKEPKPVLSQNTMLSEKGLRELIARNLHKEIHPGTKPSIDFIKKILDDAYESDLVYDVTDMRARIIAFANNSSNQALQCLQTVQKMKFASAVKDADPSTIVPAEKPSVKDDRLVFFDVEVYPNLFVVCWKFQDSDTVSRMINPTPQDIEPLFSLKLVGFNNRRYDNHILYARFLGYTNEDLYRLSQRIISNEPAMFGEAYNISYADIYDFSSVKQSLKKFEIELGVHHLELDIPWDEPVPADKVQKVVDYCVNDVKATEVVFEDRKQDFVARQILADLSGLTVNDTTQKHTARIIFGGDRNPQSSFVYTDLSKEFPGYSYDKGKSRYRDEEVGEGGYVYAEPGMYENVALLDVASMHPTSIEVLNLFGDIYTPKFAALKQARLAIKHGDYDAAGEMLGGRLKPFLQDRKDAQALSYALKIVINIVYGLTSAKFDNPFRDIRNKDNIVAKRGALFMIDLKHAVQEQGYTVAHIKTDSIKIPNATPEIIEFVTNFGAKYGYTFEHEATYSKFALVNDAVYVAKDPKKGWSATGAQFAHPYVFKALFDPERDVEFEDLGETKQVTQGSMYLDFGDDKDMVFVGRTGRFVPVKEGSGGAALWRVKDDKRYAVSGTKGYYWIEAENAKVMKDKIEIDFDYYQNLVENARNTLDHFGPVEPFLRD
jgi:hypothetical protein